MNSSKTKAIVSMALYISLAIVLDYIKEFMPFLNMPSGGSVNIALIPVVISSFHLGYKKGILVGFLWWLVSFSLGLNEWFISVPQYLLDYIIPSCVVGFSSLFYKHKNNKEIVGGILLTMFIRTLSICLSGAIYWPGDLASGSNAAWVYTFSYNLPYCIATTVMLVIIVPILLKSINKYLV